MVRRPSALSASWAILFGAPGSVTSIRKGDALAAQSLDVRLDAGQQARRARNDRNVGAGLGKATRDARANARAAPGDDGGFTIESESLENAHRCSLRQNARVQIGGFLRVDHRPPPDRRLPEHNG